MNEIVFNTKIYQPSSKKNGIFIIILNIALVIVVLSSLVSILNAGISVANISTIIVSTIVVFRLRLVLRKEPEYLACYAKAILSNEEMIITYFKYNVNGSLVDKFIEVKVPYREIVSLEYSDVLMCLRVSGKIIYNEIKKTIYKTELLVYIDDILMKQWIVELQRRANTTLTYVDR